MIQQKLPEMNLCPLLMNRISPQIIDCMIHGITTDEICKKCEFKPYLFKPKNPEKRGHHAKIIFFDEK